MPQIVLFQYCFNPEKQQAIAVEILQIISVFGITSISCLIFPYVKKVRHIWDASPYKTWRFLGIPAATIAGFFGLVLVVILAVAYYVTEEFAFLYEIWTPIYIGVYAIGIGWYFLWKAIRKKDGIDVTLAFKEIPQE